MIRFACLMGLVLMIPACSGGDGDGGGGAGGAANSVSFTDRGIETFRDEGDTHLPVGTVIPYHTDPPTSGDHYPDPEPGGFYTRAIAAGFLVHSMEHGGVIIYYDATGISPADRADLKALARQHPGVFGQVVAVPRSDAAFPIILTAWTHRLRLTTYDRSRMDGFLALFLGNGPESEETSASHPDGDGKSGSRSRVNTGE